MIQRFSEKYPEEVIVLSIDFAQIFEKDETIIACEVTKSRIYGDSTTDPAPLTLVGSVDTSGDPIIRQAVSGGSAGSIYLINAKITTSSSRVLVGVGSLPVERDT